MDNAKSNKDTFTNNYFCLPIELFDATAGQCDPAVDSRSAIFQL
jgi:hypothetical protein